MQPPIRLGGSARIPNMKTQNQPTDGLQPQTDTPTKTQRPLGITWRSIILGAILIPPNSYWIMYVEGIWHTGHPTAMSLFWNVVFTLLVLVIINMGIKRVAPRFALTQAEFVTLYVMLMIASALAGHDSLQLGLPAMSHPFYFATAENKWGAQFHQYLPKWLTVQDPDVLKGFYIGHDSLYRPEVFFAWLYPVLWWCLFIVALGTVGMCMTIIMRKQWTENERLSFPIVQLPMAITEGGGNVSFFRNRLLWVGIAIGGGIDLLNGLHMFYPNLPMIPVRHTGMDLGGFFPGPPWNAIGWTPLPLYPFIIALGFLLPLDLSFSVWFFYLFRKFQQVLLAVYPFPDLPRMPYFAHQSFGAWFTYFAFAAWMARGHLKAVYKRVVGQPGGADDSDEPISYRMAVAGIVIGGAVLYWFTLRAGMGPFAIIPFFAIFLLISIGISRMRAELGPPAHEMAGGMDAGNIMATVVGTKALGPATLAIFPLMWWFTGRGYRTNMMPCQLESFRMANQAKASPRRLAWAMMIALALGGLSAYWAGLHLQYQIGAKPGGMVEHEWGHWSELSSRLYNLSGPDGVGIGFAIGGALFTGWLFLMRSYFAWWPFHPVGYALSMAFGVDYFWSCLVISSLLKWLVMRWGGLGTYRRLLPMVFGVILGEYTVGAFWSVISVILRVTTYDFAPG